MSLLACSSQTVLPGALVLGIHTNDLVIADDVNALGLYILHQDADGRVRERLAYEVAPIRVDDQVLVYLPATMVLEASDREGDRVHARLVAYRSDRTVVTMREARAQVPTDQSRLLRLNLFFTNAGNVIDTAPGAAVLDSNVAFRDQNGPISQESFDRFRSICDGHEAGPDETSDDRGQCTALDVALGDADRYDHAAIQRGRQKTDTCYEVTRTFERRQDGAVRSIATTSLPATGPCILQLPGTYDPSRLNLALQTTEKAFPGDASGSLRPLAAGAAFTHNGDTVTLTRAACDKARSASVTSLLVSQRSAQWTAEDPVCAPWVVAEAAGSSEGSPPSPHADGGTDPDDAGDGSTEDDGLRDIDLAAMDGTVVQDSTSIAADGSEAAFVFAPVPGSIAVSTIHWSGAWNTPFVATGWTKSRVHVARFANTTEFYASDADPNGLPSVWHVEKDGNGYANALGRLQIAGALGSEPAYHLMTGFGVNYMVRPSCLHPMASPTAVVGGSCLQLARSVDPNPLWPATTPNGLALMVTPDGLGATFDSRTNATVVFDTTGGQLGSVVAMGERFFATESAGSLDSKVTELLPDSNTRSGFKSGTWRVRELTSGPDILCVVLASGPAGTRRTIECARPTAPDAVSTPLAGALANVAIYGDLQYLHVVYACDAEPSHLRLTRVPWPLVTAPDYALPALSHCASDGG